MRKRKISLLPAGIWFAVLLLTGCRAAAELSDSAAAKPSAPAVLASEYPAGTETKTESEADVEMKMNVQVGNATFTAALEKNVAVDAFVGMMKQAPVVIQMRDYAGFEKVGSLGRNLPSDDRQITTHEGDIVLYSGSQIVLFYGSNAWSYTRLGKIEDLTGWKDALGSGEITVTFSME